MIEQRITYAMIIMLIVCTYLVSCPIKYRVATHAPLVL